MADSKPTNWTMTVLRILFGAWNLFFGIVFFTDFPIEQPMGHGEMTPYLNQALIDTGLLGERLATGVAADMRRRRPILWRSSQICL